MKKKAYAKINLVLDVAGKRSDGYHNVDMIMQTIGLCDILYVDKAFGSIEISGTGTIPYDKTNLAYRAAKLFFDVTGKKAGAKIYIEKNIPVCAGMAGGSSDAAAVLTALNSIYGKPLGTKRLMRISSVLGADVPYCIKGGTARAQGIGEIITPIQSLKRTNVVVVKPPVNISTPWAYSSLDTENLCHPDAAKAQTAIEKGDNKELYALMGNSFENSVFKAYPEIKDIKERLKEMGADASLMSGSGSAVFGLFENENSAKNAYEYFKPKYKETFLTHTTE